MPFFLQVAAAHSNAAPAGCQLWPSPNLLKLLFPFLCFILGIFVFVEIVVSSLDYNITQNRLALSNLYCISDVFVFVLTYNICGYPTFADPTFADLRSKLGITT